MFGHSIKLFSIAGFEVKVHVSWLVVVLLITWNLATGFFPLRYPGLPSGTYWLMGIAGALGLFLSVTIHELSHSLVARKHKLPMKGITLFIFGGVAEMSDEPPDAKAEFQIAVAGPAMSLVLAAVFFGLHSLSALGNAPIMLTGALFYLGFINGMLAMFNLIPAFPLDGGRVLRSIFWHRRRDLRSATRSAAAVGVTFSYFLMIMGFLNLVLGNAIGGVWWVLIGLFLHDAASAGRQQVEMRTALRGVPIRRFMRPDPIVVPPDTSIREFLDDFVYRYHLKIFPVQDGSRLVGYISTREVRDVERNDWERVRVADVVRPCSIENTVTANADSLEVFSTMNRTGNACMIVCENDRLVGVVSLKDLLKFLALKLELKDEDLETGDLRKAA